jgi:hypothetical protein
MTIEELRTEYNALSESERKLPLERLELDFKAKVKPYLGFISSIRTAEGRPNEEKIRKVLQVTHSVWDQLKKLPTFKELLDLEGDFMKYEVRKKVIDLLNKEEPSAKDVELGLKVFDDEYGNKKVAADKLPQRIRVDLFDARLEDDEIVSKAGIDESEFE